MVKTRVSTIGGASLIATGTYTGDGVATQAIIGVGFQPIAILIYEHNDNFVTPGFKVTQDGVFTFSFRSAALNWNYVADMIISLDADGFTVGDGTGDINRFNINLRDYTYICWG